MRRVSYQSVLARASMLWDGKSSPDARTAAQLGVFINRRAVEFWETYPWPEWCPTERRFFAPIQDATVLKTSPDVIYDPETDAYYQCLDAANGSYGPPTDGNGTIDYQFWAALPVASRLELWDDTAEYALGAQVQHPVSLRQFQARQAVGAGIEPGAEGSADYWGEIFGWYRVIPLEQAGETVIGECLKVWSGDPRVGKPLELAKEIIQEGVLVRGTANTVWIRLRERAPSWEAPAGNYSATATYSEDDQVWSSAEGDYFRSLIDSNTGNALTDTTKWERIAFPYVLRDCVAQGAYADMLRMDGQHDKFTTEDAEARRLLRREFDKLERQQGQHRPLPVRTRD